MVNPLTLLIHHSVSHMNSIASEIKTYFKQLFVFFLVSESVRGEISQLLTILGELLKLNAQLLKIDALLPLWLEILKKSNNKNSSLL